MPQRMPQKTPNTMRIADLDKQKEEIREKIARLYERYNSL
jgi:hypothetical protein